MNDVIKAMIESLERHNAGCIKVDFGKYTIIVADKETAEFIENALDGGDVVE